MADDLDAFLQKAAQNRKKKKPSIVVLDGDTAAAPRPAPPPAPRAQAPRPPKEKPVRKASVPPTDSTTQREIRASEAKDIDSYVTAHLDPGEIRERTSHLGEHVGLADDDMDAHLRHVFEHRVGQLSTPKGAESAPNRPAGGTHTRAWLDSPDDVRRAVILNEILGRPDFDRFWRD
ncbi:MAG: hypothetical protein FJ297_15080 [Planctomycetes bacterium]|nr:hypothetical protein [Planctomycetota bacterium]